MRKDTIGDAVDEPAHAKKPRLVDANAASEFVGGVKRPRWFKDEARAGRIDAYQIGSTWCFTEESLLDLIERNFRPAANYGRPIRGR